MSSIEIQIPVSIENPKKREMLGWIVRDNEKATWILCDKSVKPLPY
jgi:hypothetical protein